MNRATYPAPETKRARLFCDRGCGWTRHAFVGRQPITANDGKHVRDDLIFADDAGHERVWGNEGSQGS